MLLETHEVCSLPDRSRYCILSVVRVECGFDGGFDLEAGSVEVSDAGIEEDGRHELSVEG